MAAAGDRDEESLSLLPSLSPCPNPAESACPSDEGRWRRCVGSWWKHAQVASCASTDPRRCSILIAEFHMQALASIRRIIWDSGQMCVSLAAIAFSFSALFVKLLDGRVLRGWKDSAGKAEQSTGPPRVCLTRGAVSLTLSERSGACHSHRPGAHIRDRDRALQPELPGLRLGRLAGQHQALLWPPPQPASAHGARHLWGCGGSVSKCDRAQRQRTPWACCQRPSLSLRVLGMGARET